MSQRINDEIDLIFLYNKVKEFYRNFLISVYRWIIFFLKHWIVLLLVVGAGLLLGYYWEENSMKSKETTMLVQVNFDGVDYVYNGVDQLKRKIMEGDENAFAPYMDTYKDIFEITEIEIEPIPSIIDLVNGVDNNNRNIEMFLDQSKYEEDLLLSDMFVSEYKMHKITLKTTALASDATIQFVRDYLNDNDTYKRIKDITIAATKMEIEATKGSVVAIDSILKVYGTSPSVSDKSSKIYLNTSNNGNIHMLVDQKITMINEMESLQSELVKYEDGVVSIVNKPLLRYKGRLLDKKMILLPIIFLFFFVFSVFVVHFFRRVGEMSRKLQ